MAGCEVAAVDRQRVRMVSLRSAIAPAIVTAIGM
jgi:hypothetical protein